ncbi:Integrase-like, catalytic domain [Phytophthora cactorum]|nr:Integrase-like, catalytic domain [Phytophthora cactorum]
MTQEINRAIGLTEAVFVFRISSSHLTGAINTMADAGSRAGHILPTKLWANLSSTWSPVIRLSGTTQNLHDILNKLQTYALVLRIQTKYAATWERWATWYSTNDMTRELPLTSNSIPFNLHYLLFIIGARRPADSPINNYRLSALYHISWHHQVNYGFSVGLHRGHKLPSGGCSGCRHLHVKNSPLRQQYSGRPEQAFAFRRPTLRSLGGGGGGLRSWTARRSEYLADAYIIRANDVKFISIHGTPATSNQEPPQLPSCFAAAIQIRQEQFGHNEALCAAGSGQVLEANNLEDSIKKAATVLGAESTRFGTHYRSSGGATAMFSAGVDTLTIKLFGIWFSDAFERYTRMKAQ